MPEEAVNYIEGWKKLCPDYELKIWNEDNFDLSQNAFAKEAAENRKWAFVTDYVRLYVLYHFGGVYMDTDVELLKPLDPFLSEHAFSGFEKVNAVPTGIMASEPGLPVIKNLLSDYDERHFILPDGSMDLHTNVIDITNYFAAHGLELNNTKQTVEGFTMYPMDWFCPLDAKTYELKATPNTVTIHHFAGSWVEDKAMLRHRKIKKLLGPKVTVAITKVWRFCRGVIRGSRKS